MKKTAVSEHAQDAHMRSRAVQRAFSLQTAYSNRDRASPQSLLKELLSTGNSAVFSTLLRCCFLPGSGFIGCFRFRRRNFRRTCHLRFGFCLLRTEVFYRYTFFCLEYLSGEKLSAAFCFKLLCVIFVRRSEEHTS